MAYQIWVTNKFPSKPQEGFLEVVIRLGGDIVVLQVLLSVEGDCFGFDFSLLHIHLIAAKHDGNLLADTNEVA